MAGPGLNFSDYNVSAGFGTPSPDVRGTFSFIGIDANGNPYWQGGNLDFYLWANHNPPHGWNWTISENLLVQDGSYWLSAATDPDLPYEGEYWDMGTAVGTVIVSQA